MPYFAKGQYDAEIIAVQLVESSNGNPQIELSLQLHGKYEPDGSLDPVGVSRYPPRIFISLTEKAMGTPQEPGYSARVLQQLGFDGDFGNPGQLEGWHGAVWNDHQAANDGSGKVRDNWSIVLPRGNATTKAPEKKIAKQLTKSFGGLFKASKPATQPPENPATVPPTGGNPEANGTPPKEEDIPF